MTTQLDATEEFHRLAIGVREALQVATENSCLDLWSDAYTEVESSGAQAGGHEGDDKRSREKTVQHLARHRIAHAEAPRPGDPHRHPMELSGRREMHEGAFPAVLVEVHQVGSCLHTYV